MIARLSSDNLTDQRVSPTPITPEDEEGEEVRKESPGEVRKRSQSQGKRRSPSGHHHHRPLAASKSSDSYDGGPPQVQGSSSSHHYMGRHRREKKIKDSMLKPPTTGGSGRPFTRTHSGSVLSSSSTGNAPTIPPRSLSPPASVGGMAAASAQDLRSKNLSPPPPTSKPPPLPSHAAAKRPGSRQQQQQQPPPSRWSGVSYKSTDSASSEDSLTADLPRHPRAHGPTFGGSMEGRFSGGTKDQPQYFPRAHTPSGSSQGLTTYGGASSSNRLGGVRPNVGGVPASDYPTHPLDNVVKNAYNGGMAGGSSGNLTVNTQHARKTSWQGKPMDYSNATHPLQMSVSRGHSQSIGSTLSNYPWQTAHNSLPSQQKLQAQQLPKR